ncbi:putative IMPACT (imprinted ancient) family translation regulator [Dysgonomonas sp. PFB1-18]|uniref:hypothetical protein n=1 Tax=unclassified Dysgonomonas TaxID=2630389 RepID=UPI002473876B|nr:MULTISPECIES: hypothetical protein [unclassified Dysgonomonas]MDH6308030.1 putative IMPACT (imprinted ancient) family translation regulator [Dysgonomonas sp. PF1-14]MDH6339569.1 putative IMPACT (imprinted ancient) family translation regulator [Dysgonomonas sp. PF1-16]MDH6381220.1 putative IMPACT (imprinted ancient) family translation regulator [Dysgonomonas sp. PFB1-18]MDH6398432.1 putative IMPACT (imprinted ancient) family translation regulator [Dysgonomonas sp. PF1-23]
MSDLIRVRVLQHDTEDQIRIGMTTPVMDKDAIPSFVEKVKEQYQKETEWCGGFDAACEKYYKRIAIVDADTLQEIHSIYRKEENNG